jgi:hypothetical protein
MKSLRAWSNERALVPVMVPILAVSDDAATSDDIRQEIEELVLQLSASISVTQVAISGRAQTSMIASWAADQSDSIHTTVARRIKEIQDRLLSSMRSAVIPLLKEQFQVTALETFLAVLDTEIDSGLPEQLRLEAPQGLNAPLTSELEKRGLSVTVEVSKDEELRATIGDTRIESAISSELLMLEQELINEQ